MTDNYINLQSVITNCKLTVKNEIEAWKIVYLLIDNCDIKYDKFISHRAGYPVYVSEEDNINVCVLGDRLEINFPNGKSKNIWFNN